MKPLRVLCIVGFLANLTSCALCPPCTDMLLRWFVRVDAREPVLLNPDFEQPHGDGPPADWQINEDFQENGRARVDTGTAFSGSQSLRIDLKKGREDQPLFQLMQSLPVEPLAGKKVLLSVRVKMTGGPKGALFGAWGGGSNERVIFVPWTDEGTFKKVELEWEVPHDPPVILLTLGGLGDRGSLWYDHCRIRIEEETVASAQRAESREREPRATHGVAYAEGKDGWALSFRAPGAMVKIPLPEGVRGDDGAVEMWVGKNFPDEGERELSILLANHAPPEQRNFRQSPYLFFVERKRLLFGLGDNPKTFVFSKPLSWEDTRFHHVVLSWNRGVVELFVDGKRHGKRNLGCDLPFFSPEFILGSSPLEKSFFSELDIDSFRIYGRHLTRKEVKERSRGHTSPGLEKAVLYHNGFEGETPLLPVRISSPRLFHMFPPGEEILLDVSIPTPGTILPGQARLKLNLLDLNGTEVRTVRRTLGRLVTDPNGERNRIPVRFRLPGTDEAFYRIDASVEQDGKEINTGQGYVWITRGVPDIRPEDTHLGMVAAFKRHNNEETFRHMKALGVKWLRFGVEWRDVEPERGRYTWEKIDPVVTWAEENDIELIATLNWEKQIPDWAKSARPRSDEDKKYPPEKLEEWEEFVTRTVDRYKGRIRYWTPWNEPNLDTFWAPRPDAAAYLELLETTSRALKKADPEAQLIGLDLAVLDRPYLREVLDGALPFSDGVSFHPYCNPHGPYEPSPVLFMFDPPEGRTWPDALREMQALLQDRGKPVDLWITEHGQNTEEDYIYSPENVDEDLQARYLVQFALEAVAGGVKAYLWYAFYGTGSFRVVELDYTPRPAGVAFYYLNRRLAGSRFLGVRDVQGLKLFDFSKNGAPFTYLVKTRAGAPETVSVRGNALRFLDLYEQPLASREAPPGLYTLRIGEDPVCITGSVEAVRPAETGKKNGKKKTSLKAE